MPKKICSRYMSGKNPIKPLSVWPKMTVEQLVDKVYTKSSYQGRNIAKAAGLWVEAERANKYVWMTMSGALTPTGLGGLVSQFVEKGYVDGIVSTGANMYHDLHFAFGLPVEQGTSQVDDDALFKDGTTRIYDIFIRNAETLCSQDMINMYFAKEALKRLSGRKFSSASFFNTFGKVLLEDESGLVKNKEGSVVISAAKYDVPIFLDSGSNHSLGMDLASLAVDGIDADMSPTQDIIEAVACSIKFQPQFNVFLGEGGPRNFLQTTGPTASEIFYVPFDGSEGGIILSVADERAGALSGSTFSEAKSWGKYKNATMEGKAVVWGEYTINFPILAAYLVGKMSGIEKKPKRLFLRREEAVEEFLEKARKYRAKRDEAYSKMMEDLQKRG